LAAAGADLSGCSSQALPDGTAGSAGSMSGAGGHLSGVGGAGVGGTGAGGTAIGGAGVGGAIDGGGFSPGSCIPNHANPDIASGGACTPDCQSVSCGIDQLGSRTCTCQNPGLPYSNCTCAPPANFPAGLQGGPCSPQGYAASQVPVGAPAGVFSLRGMPCRARNLVCFSADSTPTSERGCICMDDGVMHCGSVNHWFVNDGVPTAWQP
jgi:hypothetical protein